MLLAALARAGQAVGLEHLAGVLLSDTIGARSPCADLVFLAAIRAQAA